MHNNGPVGAFSQGDHNTLHTTQHNEPDHGEVQDQIRAIRGHLDTLEANVREEIDDILNKVEDLNNTRQPHWIERARMKIEEVRLVLQDTANAATLAGFVDNLVSALD